MSGLLTNPMTNPTSNLMPLIAELRACAPAASHLSADSRHISAGDVFLAYPGAVHDGRSHIAAAIAAGASAIVWEPADFVWQAEWQLPQLALQDLKTQAPAFAAAWYAQPSQALWMTGITGTNGKTSVAQWLAATFSDLGRKTATVGTLGNGFPGELTGTSHTTPDAVSLQRLLADFRDQGANGVAMEVSSHGLDQGRVDGVAFDVAVFTNLSRDHLDYHGDMQRYGAAKSQLFRWPGLKAAVLNADDALGAQLLTDLQGDLREDKPRLLSYGLRNGELRAERWHADRLGLRLEIVSPWGRGELLSPLLGEFNAYNLLATLGVLLLSDIPLEQALAALSKLQPVAGRMQRVESESKSGSDPTPPTVIIDFAHTPDALEKVLTALKPLTHGRLTCVFGCGGGRDTGKRPLMGAAVAAHADHAIVTSDNPRNEDPAHIVADILTGMPPNQIVELDRRNAIRAAILAAHSDDIVVLAGKGHEDYQEIHGVRHPFSDLAEAQRALVERSTIQSRNSHAAA